MAGVVFSESAAKRIIAATRRVEKMGQSMGGADPKAMPPESEFWAFIGGQDALTNRYSWVRAIPATGADPADPTAFLMDPDVAGYQNAKEASGHVGIPIGDVVKLSFVGYDDGGDPMYVFTHTGRPQEEPMRNHDHRDNYDGGFAFSVYHPGTACPQAPWAC